MKLSIVIPTYNAHEWIQGCIDSIALHHPSSAYEIIVVDDKSTDDTIAIVRQQFPTVRLFANDANVGFGKTVNVGLTAAAGEYVLVLNNDTWMHEGALDRMIAFLDTHADAGIVGPKVLSGDGSLQQQCRRRIPTPTAALLGTKVVERRRAGDLTQPGPGAAAAGVEPPPRPERLLERLAGEILRQRAIPGQEQQIAVHGVELRLGHGRKRRPVDREARQRRRHRVHDAHTPPGRSGVTQEF